jgi:hypothetical protein
MASAIDPTLNSTLAVGADVSKSEMETALTSARDEISALQTEPLVTNGVLPASANNKIVYVSTSATVPNTPGFTCLIVATGSITVTHNGGSTNVASGHRLGVVVGRDDEIYAREFDPADDVDFE